MQKFLLIFVCFLVHYSSVAQVKVPAPDIQIKSALLAAPSDKRDSAAVYGYSESGNFILLRKGTNEFICLADDPVQAGFSVAGYQKDLDPFMQRGRDLRKQGKSGQEIFNTREKEVKENKLVMPKQPTTLFVYSSKEENYDRQTGEVKNGYLRYVIYVPYATAQTTGLPLKPDAPGMPWLMNPGTHGAHIMINPPANK